MAALVWATLKKVEIAHRQVAGHMECEEAAGNTLKSCAFQKPKHKLRKTDLKDILLMEDLELHLCRQIRSSWEQNSPTGSGSNSSYFHSTFLTQDWPHTSRPGEEARCWSHRLSSTCKQSVEQKVCKWLAGHGYHKSQGQEMLRDGIKRLNFCEIQQHIKIGGCSILVIQNNLKKTEKVVIFNETEYVN